MIETAKHNCQLGVICQNCYKTAHMRLKAMVEKEALGKVHQCDSQFPLWWRGRIHYDIWWRGTWEVEEVVFKSWSASFDLLYGSLAGQNLSCEAPSVI